MNKALANAKERERERERQGDGERVKGRVCERERETRFGGLRESYMWPKLKSRGNMRHKALITNLRIST